MSGKKKKILIFVLMPVVMVVVLVLSLLVESKRNQNAQENAASEEATLSKDEEINQMLLAEYQKSQSTREYVEQNPEEIHDLSEGDAEYDDMIGNAEDDAPEVVYDGDLSQSDEDIIAQAEKDAWSSRYTMNYNGINVTCGMNQVETNGEWNLSLTQEELSADHPLLLQYDSRWATYPYGTGTMKSSACGPTSMAMVIIALTDITEASPPMVATYSMNKNYYVTGVGTSHALFTEGCSDFGLYCNEVSNNEADMKAHIDNGEILVLSVHYGNFTHSGSGHFITIYGYNENGFMVNDPGSYERSCKYWTFDVITGDINRIYALGKL